MKLMFNKQTKEGRWFKDSENPEDFTELVPEHTNQLFVDGAWENIPTEEIEQENEVTTGG